MYLTPQANFLFDIKSNVRIRFIETHLVKPLILLSTNNSILQIWEYKSQYCQRAINIGNIEPDRVQEVKAIKFHDNQIIMRLFNDNSFQIPYSIMILTSDKLYCYKYLIDSTEIITNGPIGIQNRCLEFIDSQYIAVGGEGVKIIDLKQNSVVKVMRGYHQKAITSMLSYKQNQFDRPRLVASSIDGTMACWNADTALETPAFKFLMQKKGKQLQTANDGQEVTSIAYDPYDYQIVTVSEDYITIWSSLNGMELNRYKPAIPIEEVVYISHMGYPSCTYAGHGKTSELYLLHLGSKQQKQFNYNLLIDLKNAQDIDKMIKIITISTNKIKTKELCIGTSHGLYILELGGQRQKVEFHYSFVCSMTLNQSKDFVDDTGVSKKMNNLMFEKLKSYELQSLDQQNVMYLCTKGKHLNCTLIEFTQECSKQKEEWIAMNRHCKQFQFQTNFGWDDAKILTSLSGRYIVVLNSNGYYVVLGVNNKNLNRDMMGGEFSQTLHFLSELEQINVGMANSLCWHQYKEELAVCVPLNEKSNVVQIEEKQESQTVGFFKQKSITRSTYNYDSNIVNYCIQIYGFDHTKKSQMSLLYKITNLDKPDRIFGVFNYYFICSNLEINPDPKAKGEMKTLKLSSGQFYQSNNLSLEPIGPIMIAPILVKGNLNGTYFIFIYETQFILYQQNTKKEMKPIKIEEEQITDCYFWEDLLFYVTNDTIVMLTILNQQDPIKFILAHADPPQSQDQSCEFLRVNNLESHYPPIQQRPSGELQILMLHDSKLVVINQAQEIFFISLKHPFLEILIHLAVDDYGKCVEFASKLDNKMQKYVAQLFIYKNAIDQIQYLNLDLHERLTLELEQGINETQITIDLLEQVMTNVINKENYLNDLAIKLTELNRTEELDQVIIYGISQSIFSPYSLTPLLSETQKPLYLDSQCLFTTYRDIEKSDQLEQLLCNLYNIFQL